MEQKVEKGLGWLDKALNIVEKYKFKTIFKAIIIILIVAATVGFISHPTYIFEKYKEWSDQQHKELLEKRMKNNEKLHLKAEQLLYRINADRVMILELHNGLENAAGLPFSKCSATYEALNIGVKPVADQYQSVNLSLMPFATFLFEKGYFCGNVEDLAQIDRGLYYKMMANETTHFAACVVEGVDNALAFVFVSFRATDDNHKCDEVRENIRHIALETALLLELNK
jgi:hypothetical protein